MLRLGSRVAAIKSSSRLSGSGVFTCINSSSSRSASSLVDKLNGLVGELPLKDSFTFRKHDRKWTREEVSKHSEALAAGLLDLGCKPGDKMALWLPDYAEKVACQLAAARIGMIAVCVNPSSISVEDFSTVLGDTNPRIVFVQDRHADNLKEAIPEMEWYATMHDFTGKPFRSRKFSALRYCVQTGSEGVPGMYQFINMLLYNPDPSTLSAIQDNINDDMPLSLTYTAVGGKLKQGKVVIHKDVLRGDEPSWSMVTDALAKKHVVLSGSA